MTGGAVNSSVTSGFVNITGLGSSLTPGGTYNLITAAGIAAGNGPLTFANGTTSETLNVGTTAYTLTLSSTAGNEIITVGNSTSTNLTWTGQTNGNGSPNSAFASGGGNNNFATGNTPMDYADGSVVVFQDLNTVTGTNVTNGTVVVDAAGVAPADVTVNNSAVNYTFSNASGNIGISGITGLTKLGTGLLTLNSVNTYTGPTVISGGTLNAGVAGALGTGVISLTGGILQYGAGNTQDYSSRFSTVTGQTYNIDTNGQTVTFASALTSSGGNLTKLAPEP